MNPFKYSDTNLRYHSYSYYLKHKYQHKVFKVPLNAGFTCPNRDGLLGTGGCLFCSSQGSGDCIAPAADLLTQFKAGREMMLKKWPDGQAIAYFQAYTNTYATIDTLENLYRPFADNPDVRELAIATRADCLDDTKIEYLAALNRQKPLTIELGLQSIHDETMRLMNRGHDHACLEKTVRQLHKHGLRICLHLINGLPGETDDMMLETAQAVARLKPEGVKIHMLHVLADAPLGKLYRESPFPLLTRADYVRIVINQLTCLPPETVIERLTGDGMADKLIAPLWTADKITVLNTIAKQMVQTDTFQGKNYAAAKHP